MTQYIGNVPEGAKYEVYDMSTKYEDRNIIINSNWSINQRGFSSGSLPIYAGAYVADRHWIYADHNAGTAPTVSRDTDVPTFAQAGEVLAASSKFLVNATDTSATGTNEILLGYDIEGYDIAGLVGETLTIEFWLKTNKTGVYSFIVRNSGNDRYFLTEINVTTADVWTKYTAEIPMTETGGTWDYTSGLGLRVGLWAMLSSTYTGGTAGSWQTGTSLGSSSQVNIMDTVNNYVKLTGLRAYRGAVPDKPPVIHRTTELLKCKRYYYERGLIAYNPVSSFRCSGAGTYMTGEHLYHPVEMRTAPTVTISGTPTCDFIPSGSATSVGTATLQASGIDANKFHFYGARAGTNNQEYMGVLSTAHTASFKAEYF